MAVLANFSDEMAQRSGFGGVSLDRRAGDVAVVTVTQDASFYESEVRRRLPRGTQVKVVQADDTLSDLQRQYQDAGRALEELRAEGIPLHSVGIDVARNAVVVRLSATASNEERRRVTERLPHAALRSEDKSPEPALQRTDSGGHPVYGGSYITGSAGQCTSNVSFTNSSRRYVLTAGHCGSGMYYWGFGNRALSAGVGNRYVMDGRTIDCDCVGIPAPNNEIGYTSTRVMVGGAGTAAQPLNALAQTGSGSAYSVGQRSCNSGYTTGYTCGTILESPTTWTYTNASGGSINIRGYRASQLSQGGDSGGPVLRDSTWLGLISGRAGNESLLIRGDAMAANMQATLDYSR